MSEQGKSTTDLSIERAHEQEAKFERKSTKMLTKRLNWTLELPRGTEHEWELIPLHGRSATNWKDFYTHLSFGDNQVAVTALEDRVIEGMLFQDPLDWLTTIPDFRFRLLEHMPTPEEAEEAFDFYSLPGGRLFGGTQAFGRAVIELSQRSETIVEQ